MESWVDSLKRESGVNLKSPFPIFVNFHGLILAHEHSVCPTTKCLTKVSNFLFCLDVQILQHSAADPADLRRADSGDGEGRPHSQIRSGHGDLPPAGPEQTLHRHLRLQHLQQPFQLEKHAGVQHPAGFQGPRPHPPVCQEKVFG